MDILNIFLNLKLFVGFIRNGVFPPKLTEEKEAELILKLFNSDTHDYAREKLIEHNLRLVAHIVKKYDNTREDQDDLISIGTIGLIKAVDTYSSSKNVKLATYAAKCIENEILMTLRANKKYSKDTLLSEAVNANKDNGEISLFDVLAYEEENIVDKIDRNDKIAKLKEYLSALDNRELEILTLRYGLFNEKEQTQKEIAKTYGISRSYVSRIEKRALAKLWQMFKKDEQNRKNVI